MAKPPARQPAQVPVPLEGMDGVDPTHFDGWDLLTTRDWLAAAAPQVAAAERTLDGYRLAVGLGLWHLRTQADNETAYAIVVADLAQTAGVSSDTLTRWRTSAQRHHRLPSPSPRSQVQQARPKPKAIDVASRPSLPLPDASPAADVTSAAKSSPGMSHPQADVSPDVREVRRVVAMIATYGEAVIETSCTPEAIAAAARTLANVHNRLRERRPAPASTPAENVRTLFKSKK